MPTPDPDFSLEEKLQELMQLIDKMQKGVSDFDQQVKLFQQGSHLIQSCRQYLNEAELQVQQLIDGSYEDFPVEDA